MLKIGALIQQKSDPLYQKCLANIIKDMMLLVLYLL